MAERDTSGVEDKSKSLVIEVLSSSFSRLTEKKLEVSNFQQWKHIVTLVLTWRDQDEHLTGANSSNDKNWKTVDARILGQMLNSMESHVADLVTHIGTTKELWEYLNILYSGQNNLARIYEVSQAFSKTDQKSRSLTQYFVGFEWMYEELNSLLPITYNVREMQEQREQLAVMSFLGGLKPEYDAVRSQILGRDKITSLTEVFARLLRASREPSQDSSYTGDSSALAAQGYRGGGRGRGGGRNGGGRVFSRGQPPLSGLGFGDNGGYTGFVRTCHYCGLPGHIQRFCHKLHGKPPQQTTARIAHASELHSLAQSSNGSKFIRMIDEELSRYNQYQLSQQISQPSSTATLSK